MRFGPAFWIFFSPGFADKGEVMKIYFKTMIYRVTITSHYDDRAQDYEAYQKVFVFVSFQFLADVLISGISNSKAPIGKGLRLLICNVWAMSFGNTA